ncbi:MAG: hypothetical protein EOO74_11115 [Myxococcales bacterium]|nr:MAG: hypothetical protein EOO74_11115 [Myxococcales bacterium]
MSTRAERRSLSAPLLITDIVLLAVVTGVALSPLADAYAGTRWAVAGLLGLVVAAVATLLARALRWGPLLSGLLIAVLYLLVGPAAAAPTDAIAGVLPSVDAELTLVTGIVESWRSALTMPVPLGFTRGELIVPFAIALIGGAVATTFLWRSRWPAVAALPVITMFAAAAAFGIREDSFPVLRAGLLAVLLLAWTRWRSVRNVRSSWIRRTTLGVAVASIAGVAGWGASTWAATDRREVLRDHIVPPLAQLDFKSPLSRYRDYYKNHKGDVLFTFEGLPAGNPLVRLVATFQTMPSNESIAASRTSGFPAGRPSNVNSTSPLWFL